MSDRKNITIGTRGSELALWQTHWVASKLHEMHPALGIEIITIKTTGDRVLDSPLSKIGDKGLFIKEIEKALLNRTIDIAVHSLKDVPTHILDGLDLGAVCEREDVRDVFIAHPRKKYKSLSDVPKQGTIATGSLRRKCQLLHIRPDLRIVDLRGNLQTRRSKLENSEWDGMLLAKAGVSRLGWTNIITEVLSPTLVLPAVGQGALAVEMRSDDRYVASLLAPLDHIPTRQATAGERALLRELEGGCQVPIGTYGRIEKDTFFLDAVVGSIDGTTVVRESGSGAAEESEHVGILLAQELLRKGADRILGEIRNAAKGTFHVGSADIIV